MFYGNETTGKIGQCQEIGSMGDLRAKKKKKKRERETHTHTQRKSGNKGMLSCWSIRLFFLFFFLFFSIPVEHGSSQARDRISARAMTHATVAAMLDP